MSRLSPTYPRFLPWPKIQIISISQKNISSGVDNIQSSRSSWLYRKSVKKDVEGIKFVFFHLNNSYGHFYYIKKSSSMNDITGTPLLLNGYNNRILWKKCKKINVKTKSNFKCLLNLNHPVVLMACKQKGWSRIAFLSEISHLQFFQNYSYSEKLSNFKASQCLAMINHS